MSFIKKCTNRNLKTNIKPKRMYNKSTNTPTVALISTVKKSFRPVWLMLVVFFSFITSSVYAQIPVTVTNPNNATPNLAASYTSLANAVSALNATTAMSGPVIFTLSAGAEPAPNTGLVIGSASLNAVLSATNTVTFFATPNTATLNAGTGGAAGPASAIQNGILALDGADYITIDGLRLVDGNTTPAETQMEWGIGMFKTSVTNGCQHNTIQNCTIILNRANNTAGPTNWPEGSRGIMTLSSTMNLQVSSVISTSGAGSNSFNRFYNNTIENCNIGIALIAINTAATVVATSAQDNNNDIGGSSAATGNIIRNFGSTGTVAAYGVKAQVQRELNVSYNTFTSNNGSGDNHAGILRGIMHTAIATSLGANATITNNTITLSGAGSTVTGIDVPAGGTANANTISITNNKIQNCTSSNASGSFNGIVSSGPPTNLNITDNTINNNTAAGTGNMSLIDISSGSVNTTTNISNNILTNNFKTGTTGTFTGISSNTSAALTVNSNTIYNNGINTLSGTSATACTVYGYFYSTTTASATETVTNNTIGKLLLTTSNTSSTSVLYGMYLNMTGTGPVTKTISGNIIDTLTSTAPNGATVAGIVNAGGTNYTVNISKNKIYNLSSAGALGRVHGIGILSGATTNVFNNLVGDLKAPGASSATVPTSLTTGAGVYGITVVAGTNVNLYYNTTQQAATSTGADFSTASVFAISTTTILDMRNNIFANGSTPGSNGRSVAYRRGGTSFASYTGNNNLFYAGTPGPRNLIYYDGTNSDQTLIQYKARVTPLDNVSVRENPPFLSTDGLSSNFLHINTATPSQIEKGGAPIATYTTDFDGDTRHASTPDIGADEFAGTPTIIVSLSSISINPTGNLCVPAPRTVTANVTAGSTDVSSVVINYTVNGGAPVQVVMTLASGSATAGSTSSWTGTIPVPSPGTATIAWQVVATDDASSVFLAGTSYADDPINSSVLLVKGNPNPVCSASPIQLSASLGRPNQDITVGAGAISGSGIPGPFYANFGSKHQQIMWRASELTAAGLGRGTITAISFYITAIDATDLSNDYSIKMGHTTQNDLSTFVLTSLTPVYSIAAYTQIVGTNTITLSTPFDWDGVSNLVMEICMGNPGNSSSVSSTTRVDNTSFVSGIKTSKPSGTNSSGSAMCSDNTTTLQTVSQRPQITFKGVLALPLASVSWSDGTSNVGTGNPLIQNPVGNTTYTATGTDPNGCVQVSAGYAVTTIALPNGPNGNNSTQCGTAIPAVFVTSGGAGGGYKWYDAQTGGNLLQNGGPSYTTSISTTTVFWVSESNGTCESARTMVTATVITPDAIQASVDDNLTCVNSPVQLSVTNIASSPSNDYTYTWTASPTSGSGITGSVTGSSVSVTPTAANTYTYTATGVDDDCITVSTVVVTVQSLPLVSSVTANPATICPGTTSTLTGSTPDIIPGVVVIGTANAIAENTTGTPFRNGGNKVQYLFTAAELTAAGIKPGNITGISFNVTAGAPLPVAGWQLSIGATAVASQPTTFITGLTTVYGPATVTPVSGTNAFTFASPFNWNGTSGIVLQVCHPDQSTAALTVSAMSISSRCASSVSSSGCTVTSGTAETVRPVITFNAQVAGFSGGDYNWVWEPGTLPGNSIVVSPGTATTYTVTATDPSTTCSLSGTVTVNLFTGPPAPSPNNSEQCGTLVPTASVSSNSAATTPVFVWYDAPTGGTLLQTSTSQTYLQAVSSTTDFYVAEKSSDGCESPRSLVTAAVIVPDPLIAAASSTAICPNESITLSVTQDGSNNVYEYSWSAVPAAGSGMPSPIPSTPVTATPTVFNTFYDYVVTGFDADKGCAVTDTVRLTVHPLPDINTVTATPSTVCSGNSVQLEATTNVGNPLHKKVGTATGGSSAASNPYYRAQEGFKVHILYLASDILAAGFTAGPIDAISFKVTSIPVGGVPSYKNYKISLANTSAANLVVGPFATSGLSQVYGPANFTAVLGDNVHTFNTPFIWDGVSNILFQGCYDNDVADTCTVNCTGSTPSVEATTITAYTAAIYANVNNTTTGIRDMCATATALSTQTPRANITLRRGIFNNTAAYNWNWMPGALTGPVTSVNLTNTTTYTVTATDANGCTNTGTVTATALPLPSTPVATPSSQCGVGVPAASVTGDPGVTFKWYDAATGGNLLQTGGSTFASTISVTTHFWVSASDATCEGLRAEVIATVIQPDAITAIVDDNAICLGTPIQLTANQTGSSNTYTYTWTAVAPAGSGIPTSTAGNPVIVTPTAAGAYTYTVTAFDPNTANPGVGSCTVLSSITVVVNPNPVISTATATPATICNGENTVLQGTSVLNPPATITIGSGATTINGGYNAPFYGPGNKHMQIMLRASELNAAGLTFNSNILSLGFPVTATDSDPLFNFSIKLTQTSSTTMSSFITTGLTQVYSRAAQVPIPNSNNILTLDNSFAWDGVSNLVIDICFANPSSSLISSSTALADVTSYISVIKTHSGAAAGPGIVCPDITTNLSTFTTRPVVMVGHNGNVLTNVLNWVWNPGATSGNPVTIMPATTTSYTATATYPATGCFTESSPVTVTVNPVPVTPTGTNSEQCGFGVPTASVSGAGGTYNWYSAAAGGTLLQSSPSNTYTTAIGATTTFYVAENNGNCESGRVAITVIVNIPDAVSASVNDNSVCPGTTIQLSAANIAASPVNTYTYSWTASPATGSGIPSGSIAGSPVSVTPTTAGTYTYTVLATDATEGCATTATVIVTVFTPPLISTVSANPSTPVCAGQSVQLTATSNVGAAQSFKLGTGVTGTTTAPNPYFRGQEGFKVQFLYRAADILATGLTAGPISGISFNVTSVSGTPVLNGFNIKIANTSASALTTSGWITAGMAQVFSASSYTPVPGLNTHNFSSNFIWDGVSNIVVQACWDNDPANTCFSGCTGSTPSVEYTSGVGYAATAYYAADNSTTPGRNVCDTSIATSAQNNRPNIYFIRPYSNNTSLYSWVWNPGGATGPIVTVVPNSTTTYTVTATDVNGCVSNSQLAVTVNERPTGVISGGAAYCEGQNTTTTLSITVTGTGPWSGTLSNGQAFSGSSSPITVSVAPSVTTTYTIASLFGSLCSSIAADLSGSATVSVNPLAANPTATVTQPTCAVGTATITMTAPLGAGNSYTLDGTTTISWPTVSFAGVAPGPHTITVTNSFGCSAPASASVTVDPQPFTPTAPVITGTVNVCPFINTGTQLTYHATATGNGTMTFNWVIPTTNVTIISGQGTADLTVTFQNGFAAQANKQLRVTATNQCGTSAMTVYYLLAQFPNTPNPITGPTNVCNLIGTANTATYITNKAAGALFYNWTVPANATIAGHPGGAGTANDTSIVVTFQAGFTGGNISVVAENLCGPSGSRTLTIVNAVPSTPGLISGPTNACPHVAPGGVAATYSIGPVPFATSYNWTVTPATAVVTHPNGPGANDNTITVVFPAGFTSGSITVSATNGCGTGGVRSLSVTKLNPATPSVIDVIQTHFCGEAGGRKYTYTLASMPANATSVLWTVPAGATFINLSAISIEVTYPDVAVNGFVTAQATSNCASSTIRSTTVKLPACPPPGFAAGKGETINPAPIAKAMEVKIFPNPTVSDFKLQVLTSGSEEITVRVFDNLGRMYKSFKLMPYQTIALGAELKAGSYMIEVRQGVDVKTTKLVKF